MGRGHGHQHDGFGGQQGTVTVDYHDILHGPASPGLVLDILQGLFGHARIMFQVQALQFPAPQVAYQSDKGRDGTHVQAARAGVLDSLTDPDRCFLHPDDHRA